MEIRNEADTLAFQAEKSLNEYKDKVPAEVVSDVQKHIDAVREALKGEDLDKIREAKDELNAHMQKIGEAMKANAGAAAPGAGAAAQEPPKQEENNIEEAEVEVIDEEEKDK